MRTAIGATRGRLIGQLLTESVALSLVGGALGVALAFGLVQGLVAWNPSNLPWLADVRLDATVLIFAFALAVLTGLVFGALPALYASKADLHTGLREGGRSGADSPRGQFARRVLVVGELALALALLVGAGLLIRSFDRLVQVSPGFAPDHLLTFIVSVPSARYAKDEDVTRFYDEALSRMAAVGGVQAIGSPIRCRSAATGPRHRLPWKAISLRKGNRVPGAMCEASAPAITRPWASGCSGAGSSRTRIVRTRGRSPSSTTRRFDATGRTAIRSANGSRSTTRRSRP